MIVGRNAEQGTRSPETAMNTLMTEDDLNKLYAAVQALEHPSLAARLSDLAGRPIQLMRDALPQTAYKAIGAQLSSESGPSHHSKCPGRGLASVTQNARGWDGGYWRLIRASCSPGRASDFDRDYVAVYFGPRA
jgi:hypothetical protein